MTGATERIPSGITSELGVAVASAATDSVEAEVCTAAIFGSSSLGFFNSFSVTTRSASSGSVGLSCGSSVSLTSAFCSVSCGEAAEASVSGPGGRSVTSRRTDASSRPTSIAGSAQRVVGFFGLQMDDRQRRAADVKRERDHRGKNPEPPG